MPNPVLLFPTSRAEFERHFGTEDLCRAWLFRARWPEGFRCPRPGCGAPGAFLRNRKVIQCRRCRAQTSLTSGTIFERTRHPLTLWLRAAALFHDRVSARGVARTLGLTYKTAWLWCHKLRSVMQQRVTAPPPDAPDPRTIPEPARQAREAARSRWRGTLELVWDRPGAPAGCGHERLSSEDLSDAPPERGPDPSAPAPRLREHPLAWKVRQSLLDPYFGAVSEKHLQRYVDELAFRHNRKDRERPRKAIFDDLVEAFAAAPPLTYPALVGQRASRPPLTFVSPR